MKKILSLLFLSFVILFSQSQVFAQGHPRHVVTGYSHSRPAPMGHHSHIAPPPPHRHHHSHLGLDFNYGYVYPNYYNSYVYSVPVYPAGVVYQNPYYGYPNGNVNVGFRLSI